MELRQLECFVAVAEEGTFTAAAARLHVAQPGVSAQVRKLERELGEDLFDRSGRTVRLTQVGTAALPHARSALEAVASTRLAADALIGLVRGHVAVGMLTACATNDVPEVLAAYHRDHPAVEIRLTEDRADRLVEALRDGRLDLALVALGPDLPDGIEIRVLADEPVVAAVAREDALASRSRVTLRDLVPRALISLPRGSGIRAVLDDACARAGVHPRIGLEASSPGVVADLAARGLGVAILPESVARARVRDVHPLAITPAIRGRVAFAWRAGPAASPAARALVARVRGGGPGTPEAKGRGALREAPAQGTR